MRPLAAISLAFALSTPAWASPDWPELTDPPAATGGGGKDAALIIGIEDYVFAPDIPGARANAEAWYGYLAKTRGLSPSRITLLRDSEGTDARILQGARCRWLGVSALRPADETEGGGPAARYAQDPAWAPGCM